MHWQGLRKTGKGRDSSPSSVNKIQYPRTLKTSIYHSNKRIPPPFFHPDTNPAIGHALVHSVDKIHVLVVTVDLIWLLFLNILSFNFVPTPRKSLRFTRFRRSYVNRPLVVLTNHCQSDTAFFDWCAPFKVATLLFLLLFFPSYSAFALLNTLVARILLTPKCAGRRANVK